MEIDTLEDLIAYCRDNDRVCPQPQSWNEMWNKLKNKKQIGRGWEPPLPLILAAWYVSSASSKQFRLAEHLIWADKQGQLKDIANFLMSLSEEQWFHIDK